MAGSFLIMVVTTRRTAVPDIAAGDGIRRRAQKISRRHQKNYRSRSVQTLAIAQSGQNCSQSGSASETYVFGILSRESPESLCMSDTPVWFPSGPYFWKRPKWRTWRPGCPGRSKWTSCTLSKQAAEGLPIALFGRV